MIEHDLIERGFGVPVDLTPGMHLKKCAFCTGTTAPTRIVVRYQAGSESRRLALDLPALAGLHLRTLRPASAPHVSLESGQNPAVRAEFLL